MKTLASAFLLTALLFANTARAESIEPLFFCNITEYLGSSYKQGEDDSSYIGDRYGVTKTRVRYYEELKKGAAVDSELISDAKIELSLHDDISWDRKRNEVKLFTIEGIIEDKRSDSFVTAKNIFTKGAAERVPGHGSFLTYRRANFDRIEVVCVKGY